MRYYTKEHVWLEPDETTGVLKVGITMRGNDELDGITYVQPVDGILDVESVKIYREVPLPVTGVQRGEIYAAPSNTGWDPERVLCTFDPGYTLDMSKCMTSAEYMQYRSETEKELA